MAIKGIRLSDTKTITSKYDDGGESEKTKWVIGPISTRVRAYVKDRGTRFEYGSGEDGGAQVISDFRPNEVAFDVVRAGLRGWENFQNEHGNQLDFAQETVQLGATKVKVVKTELMDQIPLDVIRELSIAIEELSSLSEIETKKSDP